MTLAITPKVLIRLGPGASFGAVFELGSALNGILGTNILGTATAQFADVTATTQAIAVRHGRDRVFEQYTTGQATIQFQDFTGDWNPENAASPYFGQIKPMRQVIITGEYSGTEYPVFAGYITSWDWTWADQSVDYALVTVTAEDGFRLLNLANIESVAGAANKDLPGTRIEQILDEVSWPDTLRDIDLGDTDLQNDPGTLRTALQAIQTVEDSDLGAFFMAPDGKATYYSRATLARHAAGFWNPQPIRTNLIKNPSLEVAATPWTSAQSSTIRSTDYAFVGSASLKTTMSSTTDSNAFAYPAGNVAINSTGVYSISAYVFIPSGSTLAGRTITASFEGGGNTAIGGTQFPATLVQNQWVRVRLLARNFTVFGTPPAVVFRLSGTLSTAVGQTIYLDGAMVEKLPTAGNYFDGDQYIPGGVYDAADTAWTGTANASTSTCIEYDTDPYEFRDDGTGIPYQDIDVNLDETELSNVVTFTRHGGTAETVFDSASITEYFTRTYERSDLVMETNAIALARATSVLAYRKQVRLRIDSITLDLSSPSNRIVPGLTLDIGDPIIVNRDMAAGTSLSLRITVQGVSHTITPDRWITQFTTAYPLSTAFILGSSEFGILGTNTL